MLNLIGKTGEMFGKDIKYFENKDQDTYYLTLICGKKQIVETSDKNILEYLDCPFYTKTKNLLVFKKPEHFYVPEYEFYGDICKSNLLKIYLFGSVKKYEEFEYVFGSEYLLTGKIVSAIGASSAIKYWNNHENIEKRLSFVILNYIIDKEFNNIKQFKNRNIEPFCLPIEDKKDVENLPVFTCKSPNCKNKKKLGIYNCQIFEYFQPVFAENIQNGIYFKQVGNCLCSCKFSLDSTFKCGLVYYYTWTTYYNEIVYSNNKIYLKKPKKHQILGAPWYINIHYDFKLNNVDCHIDVLKTRGGDYFKKNKLGKSLIINHKVANLVSFIYFRYAVIVNFEEELALAKFVENNDYINFIMNWLIEKNLYKYYEKKNGF